MAPNWMNHLRTRRPASVDIYVNNLGGAKMPDFDLFVWDEQNEDHIAHHGVTKEAFEFVVLNTDRIVISLDDRWSLV